jgi:tRNA(fMet)-specific endonuclease VapC
MVKTDQIALDTNIVIDVLNNKSEVIKLLKNYHEIYLPVTVCGELLFGAKNSAKRQDNELRFREFFRRCRVLNVNELVAETYSEIRKQLKDKGRPLPENDIWIAAICLVNDLPLATHNKHFEEIEKLTLVRLVTVRD